MAEIVKKKEEGQEQIEEVIINETPEVPPKVKPSKIARRKDKKITVIPKITGRKYLGDGWYDLEKDVPIEVSIFVARILKNSGAVYL